MSRQRNALLPENTPTSPEAGRRRTLTGPSLITNAGGVVDFSNTSGSNGDGKISAGSIEGAGTYRLGSNELTVGSNNTSTTVSGTIQDGGYAGGTGASLVKVGTGTLTLSGNNSYTGDTTVDAGALALAGAGSIS